MSIEKRLDKLEAEIAKLKNHADGTMPCSKSSHRAAKVKAAPFNASHGLIFIQPAKIDDAFISRCHK